MNKFYTEAEQLAYKAGRREELEYVLYDLKSGVKLFEQALQESDSPSVDVGLTLLRATIKRLSKRIHRPEWALTASIEEVEEELRNLGADPEAIADRGQDLARALFDKRR
jgi:hypothetical protein